MKCLVRSLGGLVKASIMFVYIKGTFIFWLDHRGGAGSEVQVTTY